MSKAGAVATGISSVIGVIGSGVVAGIVLGGATTLTGASALAVGFGVPIAGAMIGISLADNWFGKKEQSRSTWNLVTSAALSVIGMNIGSALLGSVAFASSGGSELVTQLATTQTTNITAKGILGIAGITTAGAAIGSALGAMAGISVGNKLVR